MLGARLLRRDQPALLRFEASRLNRSNPETDTNHTRHLDRRRLIQAALLATTLAGGSAIGQAWPIKPGAGATLGAAYVAKAKPGGYNYGSDGNGTAQHLIGTQFQSLAGMDFAHIPYKASGPLATDLLGGQVTMSFDTVTPVLPHIKAGKLRALAFTTAKRSSSLPDVPTLDEAGLAGFNIGTWFAVLAPAATPKDILARLNAEMVKVIHSPEFRKRMDEIGAEPIGNSAEQMVQQIKSDTEKFAKLVKDAQVTSE